MTITDALTFLVLPFAACVAFVLIHGYFGAQILRRNIIFADLALAQLSALGATVAFALGYAPTSAAGFAYAFLFTMTGAALLALTRRLEAFVSKEALVGILYVVAAALTVLVVDRSPQGADHVKKMLSGSILTVGHADLAKFVILYAAIGLVHWLVRRPLAGLANERDTGAQSALSVLAWDFFFFVSFGLVVASSVTTAGVLLVFSFLIVPAVIGSIFARDMRRTLAIAWLVGIATSAMGLAGSFWLDLPTGATMVAAFAFALVLAAFAKALLFVAPEPRSRNRRRVAQIAAIVLLVMTLGSSVWLTANPHADQPLFAAIEQVTGLSPAQFLSPSEREIYESAARDTARFENQIESLNAKERLARHEGAPLPDDEVRRVASYQRTFNEMAQGERFVQQVLRGKARERERWVVGAPLGLLALLGLVLLVGHWRRSATSQLSSSRTARSA
jgi:zinc/manganese transport system permease protein